MMQRLVVLLLAGALLCSYETLACPVCSTETGEQVRAGIFNGDFLANILMVMAPAPVMAGMVLMVHVLLSRWEKRGGLAEPSGRLVEPEGETALHLHRMEGI